MLVYKRFLGHVGGQISIDDDDDDDYCWQASAVSPAAPPSWSVLVETKAPDPTSPPRREALSLRWESLPDGARVAREVVEIIWKSRFLIDFLLVLTGL